VRAQLSSKNAKAVKVPPQLFLIKSFGGSTLSTRTIVLKKTGAEQTQCWLLGRKLDARGPLSSEGRYE